mmetsp:Transcript_1660/g.1489  ORF Transcript_1660/g.1489 Transcript_1660/m.1489 type:complete len:100 (+) Transcript_1660:489-788(+)
MKAFRFPVSFDINVRKGMDLDDSGLLYLADSLKTHPTLNQLALEFFGCNGIEDKGVQYLSSCLRHLPALVSFSFSVSHGRIGDKAMYHMAESLRGLKIL